MREIKFRAWDRKGKQMIEHEHLMMTCDGFSALDEEATMFPMEIIMQFTGLLDKNGKEIYEGDITTSEISDEPKEVVFWEGCFCHKWEDGRGHIFNPKKLEIIGNIYENPELLK